MKIQAKNRLISIIVTVLACMLIYVPVFAEINSDATIDYSKQGALFIEYKDTVDGTDPVVGAEFTVYRVAQMNFMGDYSPVIPGLDAVNNESDPNLVLEAAKAAYANGTAENGYTTSTVTGEGGAIIQNLPLGAYVVEESKPAPSHFASDPFIITLPHTGEDGATWLYDVTATPKPLPLGNLVISKSVSGDGAETERDFHFKITLNGYTDSVSYEKSNGEKGNVKNGDTVTLRNGQTVSVKGIPVGTEYTVEETEANTDGYSTTSEGATGNIKRTEECKVSFYNVRRNTVDTGDTNILMICAAIIIIAVIVMLLLLDGIKKINKQIGTK